MSGSTPGQARHGAANNQSRPPIVFIRHSVQNAVILERRAYGTASVSHHHQPRGSPAFGAERGHPRAARIRRSKCQSPSPNVLISGTRRRTVSPSAWVSWWLRRWLCSQPPRRRAYNVHGVDERQPSFVPFVSGAPWCHSPD